jgi:hypothetical protein
VVVLEFLQVILNPGQALPMLKGKYIIVSLLFFSCFSRVTGQDTRISGFVVDKTTGEKLIGCYILTEDKLSGTSTDEYGFFSFDISDYSAGQIIVSHIGYESRSISIDSLTVGGAIVFLETNFEIPEVSIIQTVPPSLSLSGRVDINPKEINRMPAFFGERDILRSLQFKPGIQMGKEGSTGIVVRGGGPDQNLFLVDGVPLYYVQHLGSLLSTFNPDAVNAAYFIKSGFPAHLGGRLSSVTDIRLKDGNMDDLSGTLSVGTVAIKGTIEGPLGDNTSFLISGRRCNLDLFTRVVSLLESDGKGMAGYTFYDANLKIKHKLNSNNSLYVTLFSNRDRVFLRFWDKDSTENLKRSFRNILEWGNHFTSFRLNHIYNHKNISDLSISYSLFRYSNTVENSVESDGIELIQNGFKNGTSIQELLFRYDHNYYYNNRFTFKFGSDFRFHAFRPFNSDIGIGLHHSLQSLPEFNSYLEAFITPFSRLTINTGIRYSILWYDERTTSVIEPRLSLKYEIIHDRLDIRTSYSRMSQPVHLVSDNSGGIPVDIWIPSSNYIPVELSDQVNIGVDYCISKAKKLCFQFDGFIKKQHNLIELLPGNNIYSILNSPAESLTTGGKGSILGFELLAEKKAGSFTGWISYMYIRNHRIFEGINEGMSYPYIYEKPHNLYVVLMTKLSENISISAAWQLTSGNSYTLPVGKFSVPVIYDLEDPIYGEAHIYGPKNSTRLKPYHRLDLSIDFHKKLKKGQRIFNISLFNAYNKQNPFFLFYMNNDHEESVLHQLCLFPIIPSLSYRYEF